MNDSFLYEKNIRNHLKKMDEGQLYDSGLIDFDLDNASLDEIIDRIISIYFEYLDLNQMVTNDFKSQDFDAPKVLRPNDYASQHAVILNWSRKQSVLNFILSNKNILTEFKNKLSELGKKSDYLK